MGLRNVDGVRDHPLRNCHDHERQDDLEAMIEKANKNVFPEEVQVDFVEVSPNMENYAGKAFKKYKGGERYLYIRISEHWLEQWSDQRVYRMVKHEMAHIYVWQNGFEDISDAQHMFTWLLGRVGGHTNKVPDHVDEWQELAEPFLPGDVDYNYSQED